MTVSSNHSLPNCQINAFRTGLSTKRLLRPMCKARILSATELAPLICQGHSLRIQLDENDISRKGNKGKPVCLQRLVMMLVCQITTTYSQGMSREKYMKKHLNLSQSDRVDQSHPPSNTEVDPCSTAAVKGVQGVTGSKFSSNAKPHAISYPSWQRFQQRVSNLPPEICRIILEMLLDEVFGSGTVHTHTATPVTQMFLSMNRQLYDRYKRIYWSQNTWIVGKGTANESMRFMTLPPFENSTSEFSRQIPNQAALKIQRLELRLLKADISYPHTNNRLITRPNSNCSHKNSISSVGSLEELCSQYKAHAVEIMQLWQDKFDRIAFLDLQHLTLDFTHAYSPDGLFLGVEAVQRFMPFVYGIPLELKIMAPSRKYEKEIRTVLDNINGSISQQGQT